MADWKKKLDEAFRQKEEAETRKQQQLAVQNARAERFIETVVIPAFDEFKQDLEGRGRTVKVSRLPTKAEITVRNQDALELEFSVQVKVSWKNAVPVPVTRFVDRATGRTMSSEGSLRSGVQNYSVDDISKEEIIKKLVDEYMRKGGLR